VISPRTRTFAKRAGLIVLGLIALDLVAGAGAVVLGLGMLKR
jgi:hypothetical protein